jgi:hypothetical protein
MLQKIAVQRHSIPPTHKVEGTLGLHLDGSVVQYFTRFEIAMKLGRFTKMLIFTLVSCVRYTVIK